MSAAAQRAWPLQDPISDFSIPFATSPVGLALCSPEGRLRPLNAAMERILIAGPEPCSSILPLTVPPKRRSECERLLRELAAGTRDSFEMEYSGTNHTFRWTVWRSDCAKTCPQNFLALVHEIAFADQGHITQESSRLEIAGRLVSSIAHDFNNWITGILLCSDLLLSSLDANHPSRKYAQEIRDAGRNASGFVRQLLSFTKPTRSQPQLLSLNDLVEGMRSMLRHLVGEGIEVNLQLDPNIGLVKIDPTQAQQVLLNLVLNARDAMPSGGQIGICTSGCKVQALNASTRTVLPCVLFSVEDHGTGIDAETLSHIFEPFFTTKAGKGTGLGLSSVRDIVTRSGGLIHVDSEPGQGTRFTVLLPVISEPPACSSNKFCPRNGEASSFIKEDSLS